MTWNPALSIVTITGTIQLTNDAATPASGYIRFSSIYPLTDVAGNIVSGPIDLTVRLVNGAFSIELPATNSPGITPSGWLYHASVNTTAYDAEFDFGLPYTVPTADWATLVPSPTVPGPECPPSRCPPIDLDFSSVIVADASRGSTFNIVATGPFMLGNPINATDAQRLLYRITQAAPGGFIMTYDTGFNIPSGVDSNISLGSGARSYVGGIFNEATSQVDVFSVPNGY